MNSQQKNERNSTYKSTRKKKHVHPPTTQQIDSSILYVIPVEKNGVFEGLKSLLQLTLKVKTLQLINLWADQPAVWYTLPRDMDFFNQIWNV